jgi:hypothetical protein
MTERTPARRPARRLLDLRPVYRQLTGDDQDAGRPTTKDRASSWCRSGSA